MDNVTTLPDGTQTAEFEFGFTLDGKAVVTEPDDNGHVYIEGLAADFGLDRQDESFEPGAFEAGLKAYMDTNPILVYHHKPDVALGQVTEANITADGLHVKARVDAPEPGTIIADYVRKIKSGTLRAFSVGGRFHRRMTANGPRIFKCDMHELSITPLPVNPRTLFAVAGKAFEAAEDLDSKAMENFEAQLARIDALLTQAENGNRVVTTEMLLAAEKAYALSPEGKAVASGQPLKPTANKPHPDRHQVAMLLLHQQKIHQLAEDTKQNAADPEVAAVAEAAGKSAKKHSAALHHIAARIGPLPDYYGPLA